MLCGSSLAVQTKVNDSAGIQWEIRDLLIRLHIAARNGTPPRDYAGVVRIMSASIHVTRGYKLARVGRDRYGTRVGKNMKSAQPFNKEILKSYDRASLVESFAYRVLEQIVEREIRA